MSKWVAAAEGVCDRHGATVIDPRTGKCRACSS